MPLIDVFEQLGQAHNQEDEDQKSDKISQNANAVGRLGSNDVAGRSAGIPRNNEVGKTVHVDESHY